MKRWIAVVALALVLIVALTGAAWAQSTNPPAANSTCPYCLNQGGMGWNSGMRGGRGMPEWAGSDQAVEDLLGMTSAELQAERLAGKSLVDIAQAKGVSEDALIAAIMNAKQADLAALVQSGKLTQAQADLMLTRMQDQVKVMVERTTTGPAWQTQSGQGQGFSGAGPGARSSQMGRGGMMGQRWNSTTR